MRAIDRLLRNRPKAGGLSLAGKIKALFANGEQGWWYDPSNFSTLYQDSAGTTPVTAVEQPVGLQLDLSKGLVLGPELVTSSVALGATARNIRSVLGTVTATSATVSSNAGGIYGVNFPGLSAVVGKTYKVAFTYLNTRSVSISLMFGGIAVIIPRTNVPVLFTGYITAPITTEILDFYVSAAAAGEQFTVSDISIKELPGNHRFQTTSANRPVVSARVNLLTKTEQFDNEAWVKVATTVTANSTNAPNGTLTADTLIETSGNGQHYTNQQTTKAAANITYTYIADFKNAVGSRNFAIAITDGTTGGYGAIFSTAGSVVSASFAINGAIGWTFVSSSVVPVGDGWYQASLTVTSNTSTRLDGVCYLIDGTTVSYLGNSTSGIYIWGADLRPTNQGVNLPVYQRVNTSTDYATTGFPVYIKPNGSNQSMVTNSINFTATDKMTVWQGVRKLSDAARGTLIELSTSSANPGSFALEAPTAALNDYAFISTGSVSATVVAAPYIAPTTTVITGVSSISTDVATIRINGAEVATNTTNQGTGNYGNYPAYFYSRNGTGRFFNGNDYGSIARGAASTAAQITAGETYINSKTKAY